jgi:hypothetical protein
MNAPLCPVFPGHPIESNRGTRLAGAGGCPGGIR